ncbi:MAG TPA: Gfo/Idh/MocA family oxidoreductase [Candidatus Saccharimonadales bacterium]|nr:Gfo/Idh/MocA family oxidoreductase [Candidatus Saccharimonadales bacterium]
MPAEAGPQMTGTSSVAAPVKRHEGPVRIAVVGCGNVMDGAYMPLLEKMQHKGRVLVVGASHTAEDRCKPILEKWKIPQYFPTYQELCRSPEVDLVVVLTSMQQHAAIALEALRAGKHVMVEKPLGINLEEAGELVKEARNSSPYLVCAPFVTLSPTFQLIRNRVEAGDVGKVCLARARYGWSGPDWSAWFYRPGSGPIFDLAVYCITSLTGVLGPAKRVLAMTGTAQPERFVNGRAIKVEVEDNAQILIDFGEAVFAVVTSGFTMQKYRSPALELYGTSGTIQMLGDDWAPEGYELWQNSVGAWQSYYETDPHWQWTAGLQHLVECIESGERPRVTPEHAYHVLEIMLAAKVCGRNGQAQEIKSTFVRQKSQPAVAGAESHERLHDRRRE